VASNPHRHLQAVSPQQMSLDELAAEINRDYRGIMGTGAQRIEMAIKIGDRLLTAQTMVDGSFFDWLGTLDIHRTTAYRYMRLAKHQDEVRKGDYDGIDPALAALDSDRRTRRSESERAEMVRMATEQGMTLEQISQTFGISKSTVWYWTSKKNRKRRGTQRRATRARENMTRMRRESKTLAKSVGGSVDQAYGLLRRTEQNVDRVLSRNTVPREARIALRRALGHLHAAEDELSRALRLMTKGD
jgi:transposase-like protein